MTGLIKPHGGKLTPMLAKAEQIQDLLREAKGALQLKISSRELSDLLMLANGAFSPLDGFLNSADYKSVLHEMRLHNGVLWPIPITLAVNEDLAHSIKNGQKIALVEFNSNEPVALMTVQDKFKYDKKEEARIVYGTDDTAHPSVQHIYQQGNTYLGGPVIVLSEGDYRKQFCEYYAGPVETRALFQEKGWSTIAAFQTRNPIHRSHEYLTKVALEISDGLFIHPVVGKLKEGDIPAEIRMECYRVLLDHYYPQDRVVLKVYPMEMRYAGPREAILHAIIRQNFGCTHLIVGRDHAGLGNYYGPFEAQNIFDELPKGSLLIRPLKLDWTFWCHKCQNMASFKTCPHEHEAHLNISGTKLREIFSRGESPPEEFSRPEIIEILHKYYAKTVCGEGGE